MHYNQAEIDIPPKITLQPEFFVWFHFSLVSLTDFSKLCIIFSLSSMKYSQNNKKNVKMYVTSFSSKFYDHTFTHLKVISALKLFVKSLFFATNCLNISFSHNFFKCSILLYKYAFILPKIGKIR